MKKNIRAVMMVAAIALVAGVNMFNSQRAVAMSDIALANVEALAREEWYDGNCHWTDSRYLLCEPDGTFSNCPCGSYGIN